MNKSRPRKTEGNAGAESPVAVASGNVKLEGALELPEGCTGVVLFAHGSGSSRHSPRNNFVAQRLRAARLGTLLIDLLTPEEDADYETRFDIALLTVRLSDAARFLQTHARTATLPIGLFGASTGAAAALQVAAEMPQAIAAVVSRGGRPDLAGEAALRRVRAPTLLIVGSLIQFDDAVVVAAHDEQRPRRHRTESGCPRGARLRPGTRDRAGRDAPFRGTRHTRGSGAPCRRVVFAAPGTARLKRWCGKRHSLHNCARRYDFRRSGIPGR